MAQRIWSLARKTGQVTFASDGFESCGSTEACGSTGSGGGRLPTRVSRPGMRRTAIARSHLNNHRSNANQRITWDKFSAATFARESLDLESPAGESLVFEPPARESLDFESLVLEVGARWIHLSHPCRRGA